MNRIRNYFIPTLSTLFLFGAMQSVIYAVREANVGGDILRNSLFLALIFLVLETIFVAKFSQATRGLLWVGVVIILSVSGATLLFFVDSFIAQQCIVALGCLVLWSSLFEYGNSYSQKRIVSRSILFIVHFVALFLFFTSSYAIHVNYAIPQWALMFLYGLSIFLISFHSLLLTKSDSFIRCLSYALGVGIFFMQFAWFIHFWPFGYLTTGVIMLIVYYIFWDLFQSYLEGVLRKQRFFANGILFIVLMGIILMSTPWEIIS